MQRHKKTQMLYRIIRVLVLLIFIGAFVEIFFNRRSEADVSRDILVSLQALALLLLTYVPYFITKKWSVEIPSVLEVLYILFAASHLLLGEIGSFYARFSWWDSMLHFISGGLIGIVGFSLINLLNQHEKTEMHLSPFFTAVFVVCFAVTLGVIWEIAEFAYDYVAMGNSQRHTDLYTGIPYVGQRALADTMKDLILDLIGAIIIAVIGYFDLKHREGKGLIKRFEIVPVKSNNL